MCLSIGEQGCFEWYMCRSAKKLPGAFGSHHNTAILYQASTTVPAIRHAVIALGSTHRDEVRGVRSLSSAPNDEQALLTVRQYNKAISHLQPCLSDNSRASIHITLLTCLLFVYMEFLRGHYTKGIVHLEHGLNLVQGIAGFIGNQNDPSTNADGWLVVAFTRLLVQAKVFGQTLRLPDQSFLNSCSRPRCDTFSSIHDARHALEQIMLRSFDIQERSTRLTLATPADLSVRLLEHQNRLQFELHLWNKTHEATLRNLPPTHNALEVFAYRLLRPYYLVTIILVGTCLESANQLSFDQYSSIFSGIISESIMLYNIRRPGNPFRIHHDPEASSSHSVSDIGWIGPLYFTMIHCRNHRIRHQAVKLLQKAPHKEGIWDAPLAVAAARKVIEIEEGNFYDHLGEESFDPFVAPADEDLQTKPALPEECRLSNVSLMLPEDRAGRLLLRCCRKDQRGFIVPISLEYDLPSNQWHNTA